MLLKAFFRSIFQTDGGRGVFEMALEVVGQCND